MTVPPYHMTCAFSIFLLKTFALSEFIANFALQSERKALSYWNKTKRYAFLAIGNVRNFHCKQESMMVRVYSVA